MGSQYPSSGGSGSSSPAETAVAVASLALFAVALILMAWALAPPAVKTRMRLAPLLLWRRALSQLGRHIGVRSMARELRTGQQDYSTSYRLALAADRMTARINLARQGLS